ncbi:MAG TPA: flagellar export chaperone FliS [Polyangiales bacterium]|jgi:flagellar protein FliS
MSRYATGAYATVGMHTAVEAASPHKLVLMLYDGLLKQLRLAKAHMSKGEIGPKATCISRALSILDQGLLSSLNLEAGGDIANQLQSLYMYCGQRLLQANMRNDPSALDEVVRLIEPLRSAWFEITPQPVRAAQGAVR